MLYNINVKEDTVLPFDHKFVRKLMNAVQINHLGALCFIREQNNGSAVTSVWLTAMRIPYEEFYTGMKLHRFAKDSYELLLLN